VAQNGWDTVIPPVLFQEGWVNLPDFASVFNEAIQVLARGTCLHQSFS